MLVAPVFNQLKKIACADLVYLANPENVFKGYILTILPTPVVCSVELMIKAESFGRCITLFEPEFPKNQSNFFELLFMQGIIACFHDRINKIIIVYQK